MRIEEDLKLDFGDVLIRPKRSTLTSRSEVDIAREYTFRHSRAKYKGIPVIAANMDTVGTFAMAQALFRYALATALHKHYGKPSWWRSSRRCPPRRRCSTRWASATPTTRSSAA